MYRNWLNRRIAALLSHHLKYNYQKMQYMCNCLNFGNAPLRYTLGGFITRRAIKLVNETIAQKPTLWVYLVSTNQWPGRYSQGSGFIAMAGFPFYTTLISKLRGENHVVPIQTPAGSVPGW